MHTKFLKRKSQFDIRIFIICNTSCNNMQRFFRDFFYVEFKMLHPIKLSFKYKSITKVFADTEDLKDFP
jgi:hypothetical protein